MTIDNKTEIMQEIKKEEPLVAIYNNSNEIFGISNQRLLKPRGNARVPASEANMLIKNHKHAIHLQMIDEKKTLSDFAAEKDRLNAEIAAKDAEIAALKAEKLKNETEDKGRSRNSSKKNESETEIS